MQTLFQSIWNISAKFHKKTILIISSYMAYTVSKFKRFLRHSVVNVNHLILNQLHTVKNTKRE